MDSPSLVLTSVATANEYPLVCDRLSRTIWTVFETIHEQLCLEHNAALPTFKIKIMGSETQNYRISRKIIVHKFLVHILPADGASLLQI